MHRPILDQTNRSGPGRGVEGELDVLHQRPYRQSGDGGVADPSPETAEQVYVRKMPGGK